MMFRISRISFGSTAAIVTSMALITGLGANGASKAIIVSALLIAALADNLTDSLSIHIYQESERLEQREAFIGTMWNFVARLAGGLSFALIVVIFPPTISVLVSIIWGMFLLIALTYLLARDRKVSVQSEIVKHLVVALSVIALSKGIAYWLSGVISLA